MSKLNIKELVKDLKNPRAIIPNLLSSSRILAPFIIPPLALSGNIPLTIIAAAAFMSTDFLDGKIARALNGETKLGMLLDQISDKVCSIGLLLALTPTIPLMMVPLILESTIAIINIKASTKEHKGDGKSTSTGRLKMWPLSISIVSGYGMLLAPSLIFEALTYISLLAASTLEIINVKEYYELSKPKDEEEEKISPIEIKENKEEQLKSVKKKTNTNDRQIKQTELENLEIIPETIFPITEITSKPKVKQKKR